MAPEQDFPVHVLLSLASSPPLLFSAERALHTGVKYQQNMTTLTEIFINELRHSSRV